MDLGQNPRDDFSTTQIASPEGTLHYGYDAATGRHTRTWPTYSDIGYGYDELGRLQTVSVAKRDGVMLGARDITTHQDNAVGAVEQVSYGT